MSRPRSELLRESFCNTRATFHNDVVLDIVGFRKFGHNELDEPMLTQPLMYKRIKVHPNLLKIYSDKLLKEGLLTEAYMKQVCRNIDRFKLKSLTLTAPRRLLNAILFTARRKSTNTGTIAKRSSRKRRQLARCSSAIGMTCPGSISSPNRAQRIRYLRLA